MAELLKMLERRDKTGEPMHVRTCTYLQIRALIRLVAAATIRERSLFRSTLARPGEATIRERRLFESGVYSVIYGRLANLPIYVYDL